MERVMGVEPTWLAWKARTLPLSYTRLRGARRATTAGTPAKRHAVSADRPA